MQSIKLGVCRAVQEGEQPRAKRKRNRILIVAACLLIGIPTTAFGAAKVYDIIVQKQNYEVNISVSNTALKKSDKWYKLKVGNLPKNMEAVDPTGMKYFFKDNYAKGGFSFILWKLGENSDFSTLYSNSYEEKKINGRKAIIINKDSGNENLMFNRQVFMLFEEEGIMLESYIGADVSEEQMMKVIANTSLKPTSKENASITVAYDDSQLSKVNEAKESKESRVIPLKKDSKQLFRIGQKVPVTIEQEVTGTKSSLEYVIKKVEVFDSIKDFKQENFNKLGLEILSKNKVLDQTRELLPYRRNVYKVGNGKDSIDQLVESNLVNLKFVYLTTTVKNTGKQATEEIYMHPSLQELKPENNAWNYAGKAGINEASIITGEVDYLEPHGSGKSFYNIGSIQPGQTKKINLGYFVDEDKLDSIFLDAFHYSGVGNTEDMNAENRWWIDIRQ
ncbi:MULTISPECIES: anti-sigma factor [Cytobacillus]|uniref:Anti-sigma factor n=1 Tax=Cytobacillus oceanisediminis TaxID=665099 RepID=A0ABX3CJM4_9BACI|nr:MULTISPECIES: anti-sigma factor [Cytobacillus]OHX40566.1 anti-sigma factor [Cytobacillus oceanisediminis]